jgi:hypothetical protein
MLRPSTILRSAVVAAALLANTPCFAQGGLSGRLADSGKQLDAEIRACQPVNLGQYQSLLNEAAQNKLRAQKMAKKGVPVDEKQVDADLAAAPALLNRALAAHGQQCVRAARQHAPVQNSSQTSANLSPFEREVLAAHNIARAAVGAPPLKWSPGLTARAALRAREMAQAGRLFHAPREGRGTVRENVLQAPANYSTAQMMDRWMRERSHFVPGIFPNICNTDDNCSGVLHYSQIIWPETTEVGCGYVVSGGFTWQACLYDPGGNKDGKPVGIPTQEIAMDEQDRTALSVGLVDRSTRPVAVNVDIPKIIEAWFEDGTRRPCIEQPAARNDAIEEAQDAEIPLAAVEHCAVEEVDATVADHAAAVDTKVEQPTLPGAEVFKASKQACSTLVPLDASPVERPASLFDLGIYSGGAYTTEWFTIDGDEGIDLTGDSISPGAVTPAPLYPDGKDPVVSKWDFVDTKVEAPVFPPKEVFDPEAWKKKPCDIM